MKNLKIYIGISFLFVLSACQDYESNEDIINMRNLEGEWELQDVQFYSSAGSDFEYIEYDDFAFVPGAGITFLEEGIFHVSEDPYGESINPFFFTSEAVNYIEGYQISGTWEYVPSTFYEPILHFNRLDVESDYYAFIENVSEDELIIYWYPAGELQEMYWGLDIMAEYFSAINWYEIAIVSDSYDDGYYLGYQLGLFDSFVEEDVDAEIWDKYFPASYGSSYSYYFWNFYYDEAQMDLNLLDGFWAGHNDGSDQGLTDFELLKNAFYSDTYISYYFTRK